MTEEEMKDKIEQLEQENKNLRAELSRNRKKDTWPDDVLQKYPNLQGILYETAVGRSSQSKYKPVNTAHKDVMSRIIRQVLFNETSKVRRGKNEIPVEVRDMTDSQYQTYLITLDAILKALSDGREIALAAENGGEENGSEKVG